MPKYLSVPENQLVKMISTYFVKKTGQIVKMVAEAC